MVGRRGGGGWRGGQLIGTLPLPLTRADADLMLEMCLHRTPGDGTYAPGVTGTYFMYQNLMQVPIPQGLHEQLGRDPTGRF